MTIDEIYDEVEGRLRRFALSLTRDPDRADDLVQETFIRALANLYLLQGMNVYQRRSWMRRTLKNLFIDEQRARQRQHDLVQHLARETEWVSSSPPDLSSEDLFEQIPERDRELLHQRYVLGMTGREIATELGIPAATVRSRLHLAIKRLRARKSQLT